MRNHKKAMVYNVRTFLIFGFLLVYACLATKISPSQALARNFTVNQESYLHISAPSNGSTTGEVIEVLGKKYVVLSDYPDKPRLYLGGPYGETSLVSNQFHTPKHLIFYKGFIFFSAIDDSEDEELWRFDYKSEVVTKINLNQSGSSAPKNFIIYKGKLYFTAHHEDLGREIWTIGDNPDGSNAQIVKDITTDGSSTLSDFLVAGDFFYFVGPGLTTSKKRLWISDGTDENTYIVNGQGLGGLYDSDSSKPFLLQGSVYFYRHSYTWTSSSTNLYKVIDGGAGASAQFIQSIAGGSSSTYNALSSNNYLYFLWAPSQRHLNVYNPETSITTRLALEVSEWKFVNEDVLYFISNGELFKAQGATKEAVSPGTKVNSLAVSQGVLYMLATNGQLLYTTPEINTVAPVDTSGLSAIKNLSSHMGKLYFSASLAGGTDLFSIIIPASQTVQQRHESCGDIGALEEYADNAILLTHGWNSSVFSWVKETADIICDEIGGTPATALYYIIKHDTVVRHCNTPEWDVYLIDWSSKADFSNGVWLPRWAYQNAASFGSNVGSCLKDIRYEHVHLLGHSAGSNLIDNINRVLKANIPQPTVHMTFFDAYDPYAQIGPRYHNGTSIDMQISNYGKGAEWVDNYVDVRQLENFLPDNFGDWTKTFLPSAYNVDVTQYDTGFFSIFSGEHSWPYEFYKDHTMDQISSDVVSFPIGFQLAREHSNTFPPLDRPIGNACQLPERGEEEFQKACDKLYTVPFYNEWDIDEVQTSLLRITSLSETGNVAFHDQNATWSGSTYLDISTNEITQQSDKTEKGILSSASTRENVWVSFELNINTPVDTLEFEYEFINTRFSEGLLSVFINENVIWQADERYFNASAARGSNINKSSRIFTGKLLPGKHTLSFRIDKYSDADSRVYITNLKLGQGIVDQDQSVFPWSIFFPVMLQGKR